MDNVKLSHAIKTAPRAQLSALLGRALRNPFAPDDPLVDLSEGESAILEEVERSTTFRRERLAHDHLQRLILLRVLSNALAFQSRNSPEGRAAALRVAEAGERAFSSYDVKWDDQPVMLMGPGLSRQDVVNVLENPRVYEHALSAPDSNGRRLGVRISVGTAPGTDPGSLLIVHTRYLDSTLRIKALWRVPVSVVPDGVGALDIMHAFLLRYGIPTRYSGAPAPKLLTWDEIVPQSPDDLRRGADYVTELVGPMEEGTDYVIFTDARSTQLRSAVVMVGYAVNIARYATDAELFSQPLNYEAIRNIKEHSRDWSA